MTDKQRSQIWDIPDFSEALSPSTARKNALNMPLQAEPVPQVEEEAEENVKPLTAEELEQIREAARLEGFQEGYQEGLLQGQQKGHEQGYEEGKERGTQEAQQDNIEVLQQLETSLSEHWSQRFEALRHPFKQVERAVENQLISLAMALSRAICWQEVTQNQSIIIEAAKRALDEVGQRAQQLELYVHPDELESLERIWGVDVRAEKGWIFLPDASLSLGGCRIKTSLTEVNATLEQRIEEVFAQLQKQSKPLIADLPQTQEEIPKEALKEEPDSEEKQHPDSPIPEKHED